MSRTRSKQSNTDTPRTTPKEKTVALTQHVCVRTTLCNSVDSSPGPCNVFTTVGVD